jgi:hypothetical protein
VSQDTVIVSVTWSRTVDRMRGSPTVYSIASEQSPAQIRDATIGTTASVGYIGPLSDRGGRPGRGANVATRHLRGGGLAMVALVLGIGALAPPGRARSDVRAQPATA